jgi:hypothetical protein
MITLHEAALSLAERGYRVFPVKPLEKKPATRHGFKDATTELPTVNAWWEKNALYNIGLACEVPLFVFDVDTRHGGDETFARMCAEISASMFDGVPLVKTPGGRQFWFRQPEPPIARKTGILPGIDLLGVGGYAIAPPSVRNDGSYIWTPEFEDDAEELRPGDLPEFPRIAYDYLIAASTLKLVTPSKLVAVPSIVPAEAGKIDDGWRGTRLASLAGTLVAGGYGDGVGTVLHALNEKHCDPRVAFSVVESIVKSASRNFRERYVEATFVKPWLCSDFGITDARKQLHALRLLVLYAKLANEIGVAAPSEAQAMNATGLSERHYRAARLLLETAGAIVVQERNRTLTTLVVLQWKPVALNQAA